jgi:hypothetical protein
MAASDTPHIALPIGDLAEPMSEADEARALDEKVFAAFEKILDRDRELLERLAR